MCKSSARRAKLQAKTTKTAEVGGYWLLVIGYWLLVLQKTVNVKNRTHKTCVSYKSDFFLLL